MPWENGSRRPNPTPAVDCLFAVMTPVVMFSGMFGGRFPLTEAAASDSGYPVQCVVTRIAEIRFEVMARAIQPCLIPLLAVLLAIAPWPPLTLGLAGAMRGG